MKEFRDVFWKMSCTYWVKSRQPQTVLFYRSPRVMCIFKLNLNLEPKWITCQGGDIFGALVFLVFGFNPTVMFVFQEHQSVNLTRNITGGLNGIAQSLPQGHGSTTGRIHKFPQVSLPLMLRDKRFGLVGSLHSTMPHILKSSSSTVKKHSQCRNMPSLLEINPDIKWLQSQICISEKSRLLALAEVVALWLSF